MQSPVVLEISSNQRFIFAANKLAENFGALQMSWEAGLKHVLQAVEQENGRQLLDPSPREMRNNLRDPARNPPRGENGNQVEVVTAASGKAVLLVGDCEIGRKLVYSITKSCLEHLPGVDLRGLVGQPFDLDDAKLDAKTREVHEGLASLRGRVPGPELRRAGGRQ